MTTLYEHIKHPHHPRNVNRVHADETRQSFNMRLAVWLTSHVGTMQTAYSFVILAVCGLLAILGILPPVVALLVAWLSQTFIQLVLLPVIMVGQNVLSRHGELVAEEQFNTTTHSFHDIEQIIEHLHAQDVELLKHTTYLVQLLEQRGKKKINEEKTLEHP